MKRVLITSKAFYQYYDKDAERWKLFEDPLAISLWITQEAIEDAQDVAILSQMQNSMKKLNDAIYAKWF